MAARPAIPKQRASGVGTKARGLERLPDGWTPPFVALGDGFASGWETRQAAVAGLSAIETAAILALIELATDAKARLIVRSDSATELQHPGRQRTRVTAADLAAVVEALDSSMRDLGRDGRPIVQLAVEPAMLGLLSNARHLTRDSRRFLGEGFLDERPLRWLRPRRVGQRGGLAASTIREVTPALERSLAELVDHSERLRIEWAWDGRRVWILQADLEPETSIDERAATYLTKVEHAELPTAPVRLPRPRFEGVKIARARMMEQLGWPVPPVLASADFGGQTPVERLAHMLEVFAGRMVVVRTDVRSRDDQAALLLPTSPPARDPDILYRWAEAVSDQMAATGVSGDGWSFLASELVPARSSAWVHADSNDEEVRVEALWGYPDGLLHLPHDSFRVVAGEIVARSIRHKPACLLADDGEWRYARLPEPFDWQPSLGPREVGHVASWGRQLAQSLEHPVQLMVLARVGGRRTPEAIAPFFFTTFRSIDARPAPPTRYELTVSDRADLAKLAFVGPRQSAVSIHLDPAVELVRDPGFLGEVGEAAAAAAIPIAFRGSQLGHAFHLLADAGAVVFAPEDVHAAMPKQELMPVVVRRRRGLARVQNIPIDVFEGLSMRLLAAVSREGWHGGRVNDAVVTDLATSLAGGRSNIREARRALREGRLDALISIEEGGDFQLPLPPDAPGVVPLFMDEASDLRDQLPTVSESGYLEIKVPAAALAERDPSSSVVELSPGMEVSWTGTTITIRMPTEE